MQVEPAVKRASLEDRKKRKLGQIDEAAPAIDITAAKANPTTQQAPVTAVAQTAAPRAQQITTQGSKTSVKAAKKARNKKDVSKTAANPKQQLLRTVALGNLQADCKAEAVELAKAAGKVPTLA